MKKAALHNLGCKVNSYETDAMQQLLEKNGYEIVPFDKGADVYIINTCSVTNMADRKSRQMVHKAKKLNPDAIVVAAGCYVQTSKEEAKLDEAIDIIIGNNKKNELIEILKAYETDSSKKEFELHSTHEEMIDINDTSVYEELSIEGTSDHTRAFIKVQDGCNQFCSYCIIPYARGRVRSRNLRDILHEVKALGEKGYKEIVLTGIHLSSYGIDLENITLLELIKEIHKDERIQRIRLGSLEPRVVTEEFVKEISKLEKFCPHFHLSLQSGCDETLLRMNRHYNTIEYMDSVILLRKYFENPAITTDIIVGFPGETDNEFMKTIEFVEAIRFFEIHIFKFSKRKGTKAAEMKDQVKEEEKTRRSNLLHQVQGNITEEILQSFLGKEIEILVEEETDYQNQTAFKGHSKEYVKAVCIGNSVKINELYKGIVTEILEDNSLIIQ